MDLLNPETCEKVAEEHDMDRFSYTEFLAATFDLPLAAKKGICKAAFSSFDKNNDGSISISELATGKMLGHLSMDEVMETMDALDVDGDCQLDYREFMRMMHSCGNLEEVEGLE